MVKQYKVEAKVIIDTFAEDADQAENDLREELDVIYPDAIIEVTGVNELNG